MQTANVNKIGIIMYGLLGDVLMRTPIIDELKRHYNNAEIIVFVDPIGKAVLENNPNVDNIVVTDRTKKNRFKYYKNKVVTQIELYKHKLDMIIDLYGGKSANTMVQLSCVKYQLGFKNSKLWSNGTVKFNEKVSNQILEKSYHLTNRLFTILSFLNLDVVKLDTTPLIYSKEQTDRDIENYMKSFGDKFDNTYIISLGSGGLEKVLDLEKTFEIVKHIYETKGLIPSVVLNPGQEYLQEDFINNYLIPHKIEYIKLKKLSIEEIVSLMKIGKFITVPDTGLYHIAVSVGIPIFSVFTFSNPELVKPVKGRYEICFEPTKNMDPFGLPLGTNEMSLNYIKETFINFYEKLK